MKKLGLNFIIFTTLLGVVFAVGDFQTVFAQGNEEFTLEEITVTAQKREENQQKVGITMEVLTGEDLKKEGKSDLDEILSNLSSTIIARTEDGLRVTIRGISDTDSAYYGQSQSMPTVAVNIDGVRSNRKDKGSSLFDLERVEVLYGPQSTLYSTNSPAGVVNVVTAQPNTEKFEVSGTIEMGNYSLIHTEGVINVPFGDKFAIRTSFNTESHNGYITDGTDDLDTKTVRLRTLFKPNDKASVLLTAQFSKSGGIGMSMGVDAFVNQDDVPNPWLASESFSAGTSNNKENEKEFNATINLSTAFGTITMVPNYSTGSIKNRSNSIFESVDVERISREKGAEARIASNPDFLFQWVLGYNWYEQTDNNHRDVLDSEFFSVRELYEKASAIFGNITYPVTDKLRLIAGYRQSWDKIITHTERVSLAPPVAGTTETPIQHLNFEFKSTYDQPDYKAGFEYDLGSQSMIYANYTTSYRVKAFGSALGTNAEPEELDAYTLGAKNRFFGNKLQVNASVFYYDYRNYSASQMFTVWYDVNEDGVMQRSETSTDEGSNQQGDGRNIGFDLQTSTIITPQDLLNFSWSYIKSEWTDLVFNYEYPVTDAIDPDTGNVIHNVPVEDVSYNGKPMTNSPPHTFSAGYSHNFLLPNGSAINANITARYQTEYRLSWKDSDYPLNNQESYRMIDLSAVYTNGDGNLSLSFYVKNLENYAVKRNFRSGFAGLPSIMAIGAPRTYGAILSARF